MPWDLCYHSGNNRVYCPNQYSSSVTVMYGVAGIEEMSNVERRAPNVPTVVRGVLWQQDRGPRTGDGAELLDVSGRRVLALRPGANDVSRLAPGVYFVRGEGRGAGDEGTKVVVQR
jgi:hypothetical protein